MVRQNPRIPGFKCANALGCLTDDRIALDRFFTYVQQRHARPFATSEGRSQHGSHDRELFELTRAALNVRAYVEQPEVSGNTAKMLDQGRPAHAGQHGNEVLGQGDQRRAAAAAHHAIDFTRREPFKRDAHG